MPRTRPPGCERCSPRARRRAVPRVAAEARTLALLVDEARGGGVAEPELVARAAAHAPAGARVRLAGNTLSDNVAALAAA